MLGVGIWRDWLTVLFQGLNRSRSPREVVGFCLPIRWNQVEFSCLGNVSPVMALRTPDVLLPHI